MHSLASRLLLKAACCEHTSEDQTNEIKEEGGEHVLLGEGEGRPGLPITQFVITNIL